MSALYRATVLGGIWWPIGAECSLEVGAFRADSDAEAIEHVWAAECGDFSSVRDVYVTAGECSHDFRVVKAWRDDETEIAYLGTLGDES